MATYKLTAADRRVLAQMQAKRANNRAAATKAAANSQTLGNYTEEDKYKDANPLLRGVATAYDVSKNVSKGAFKSLEGVVDLGASLVGGIGGLFSDDFQKNIRGFIEEDWASKLYDEGWAEWQISGFKDLDKYSYTNDNKAGQTIEQVAQGVGQMLPTVAVAIATGGAGVGTSAASAAGSAAASTGAKAALSTAGKWALKNAGTIYLGASAAGTGIEEAFNDGAGYGEGMLYGAASGAVEVATEKLLPGVSDPFIGGSIFGKGAKKVADQGVKRGIKQIVGNAINEGVEEMVSEATNPLRKSIYKGRDAFKEYGDEEFWKDVGEAGTVGALTSVAFGSTVGKAVQGKGYNGDIQASMESIKELKKERSALQEKDVNDSNAERELNGYIEQNYKQIENVLKNASTEKRAEYIERYELDDRFADDGTYTPIAENTAGIDRRYVSADARGQEVRIKEALDREGVTAYHGELTEQGNKALKEVYRAHNALSKLGFADKHVVIVNEMKGTNAYLDGNIIAIGKDMLENGEHIKKLIHETTHFTEGSAEWAQVADFVFGKDAGKVKTNLAKEISAVLDGGYGVTEADVDAIVEHIRSGYKTTLTEKQGTLIEEVIANRMENLFGDSESVARICREKPGLARRIWERIKALIDSLGQTSSERQEIKKLRETERLFRAALETGGQDYIRGEMESASKKEAQYSLKVKYTNGKEEIVSPYNITDEDVINYLNMARKGQLENYAYFPVRSNTPQIIITTLENNNIIIKDSPMIMQALKAKNSQLEGKAKKRDGSTIRFHSLSPTEIIEAIKKIDEPISIIRETNRFRNVTIDEEEYLEPAPDRYPTFVKLDNGKECVVVLEFNSEIDDKYITSKDEKYKYHTTVTVFEPDKFFDEDALDYAEHLLKNDDNYELVIMKESPKSEAAHGKTLATASSKELSNNSISQNPEKSTPEVKKSKKIQYSYAGDKSKTANHSLLAQAKKLEAQGVDSEEIRQKTGWFKGYDGKWRYEIDDSAMEILDFEVNEKTTLGKLIKHDKLFEAYPELKDLKVYVGEGNYGFYSIDYNYISLGYNGSGDYSKFKYNLLHEIQHAIQIIEGFGTGSSVDYWEQVFEEENREEYERLEFEENAAREAFHRTHSLEENELADEYVGIEVHRIVLPPANGLRNRDVLRQNEIEKILRNYGSFDDFKPYLDAAVKAYKFGKSEPYEHRYMQTAGEIEARDVSSRMNLTSEQRKNTRPDIDQDEVYFSDYSVKPSHNMLVASPQSVTVNDDESDYSEYDKPITLHDVEVLRSIGRKSINEFTSEEIKIAQKWAYKFYKELGVKSPFFRAWFGDWRQHQKKTSVNIAAIPEYVDSNESRKQNRGTVKNTDTEWNIRISREGETNTISHSGTDRLSEYGLAGIRELIQHAILLDSEVHEHHSNNAANDNISFDHKLYSLGIADDGSIGLYKITVEEYFQSKSEPANKRFHNLKYIEKVVDVTGGRTFGQNRSGGSTNGKSTTTYSISDLFDFVKTYDKEFKPNSVSEYLIDKETGFPKVFYLAYTADADWSKGVTVYQKERANTQPVYISSYAEAGKKPNFEIKENGDVIVYDAGRVKSAADGGNIGTFDRNSKKIQYSRKASTDGAAAKPTVNIPMRNRSQFKIYTKENAEQIISGIACNTLSFNDGTQGIIKNKGELVDLMWRRLNSTDEGKRGGVALDLAEEVLKRVAVKAIYDDPNNAQYVETVSAIKEYMQSFNLNAVKSELEHRFGKNKSKGIMLAWGAKNGERGISADSVAQELTGQGIVINAENEADAFFEIHDLYSRAREALKRRSEAMLDTVIPEDERNELKQAIAKEILEGFYVLGKKSMVMNMLEQQEANAKIWKEQYYDSKNRAKAIDHLFETVDCVRNIVDMKKADEEIAEEVENLVKLLKKVKTTRGNLAKNVREIMKAYASPAGDSGVKLYDLISDKLDGEKNPFAEQVISIANGNGELSTREIQNLDAILRNFIHNANNYKRVFLDGKRVEAIELIEQGLSETAEAMKVKDEGLLGLTNKMKESLQAPVWRFERLGCYRRDSVMMKLWREFQNGFSRQARFSMEVAEHYKEFFKKHKNEIQKWRENTYEVGGRKVSRGQMLSLYLTSLREQGRSHIFGENDNGVVRFSNEKAAEKRGSHAGETEGFDTDISRSIIVEFEKTMTDSEREFIALTQKFFNEMSKNAKIETDEAMYGVSNVVEDNYYPLRVADDQIYRKLGDGTFRFADLFNLYSPSFNKATVDHANNKLVIENVIDVVNRHAKQMANYYGFARAVKTFNRVYNMKLENGQNMRSAIGKIDSRFEDYVGRLIQDIQGNRAQKNGIQRVASKVRGWGAKAALGANLKVLTSQFVSMPASAAVGMKYRNIAKGFKIAAGRKTDYEAMFKYVPMLYDRFRNGNNIDVGLLKEGTGILGQLDWLTDLTTAPIGKIDALVCCAVWNAAVEQTKSDQYGEYSEQHYKAAAELTEQALIKTQANYAPLYRAEILRNQDSFVQMLTMFMGEPLQQFSLITSSVEKMRVTRRLARNASEANKAEYERVFNQAKSEAAHALTAVFVDTVILTAIAQLFKWIKGKEDEDKVKGVIGDFVDNYVGMIPIFKDVYNYIINGYDVTNMAYTGLTNVADGLMAFGDIIDLLASGGAYDEKTIRQKLRKTLLGISQTFGIPLRNLETYATGILEKIFPDSVYKYDALFFSKSQSEYSRELTKAISKGDTERADTILGVMFDEKGIGVESSSVRHEIRELIDAGYSVIPKGVGSSVMYDGEEIALTKRQQNRFKQLYSAANEGAAQLVRSSLYNKADEAAKAKAIKFLYDTYFNLALQESVGVDLESKNVLFAEAIDIENLAIIYAIASGIEADKDRNGNAIVGSRKTKIEKYVESLRMSAAEKYLIMGYLGYKCKNGADKVKAYVGRLNLTKDEKQKLMEYCGYVA